ncbi:MAG: hypothetical protein RBT71_01685 [Flavobacteriales bacterium]|jgi:hypothetical protein|nr:hypothetical protein [Flavobacteriales bacterium]
MNSARRSLTALAVVALHALPLLGQWGVRAGLGWEQYTPRLDMHWALGVDRDVSGRTSIGLDLIGVLPALEPENMIASVDHGTDFITYTYVRKGIGAQYRSMYFLGGDTEGWYVATSVGFRSLVREMAEVRISAPDGYRDGPDRSTRALVFPVGVRVGLRSALDGFFQDAYIGVGHLLGSGNDALLDQAPYLIDKHRLKGLSVQVGYSFGVGW